MLIKLTTFNKVVEYNNKQNYNAKYNKVYRNNYLEKQKLSKSIVTLKNELHSLLFETNECNQSAMSAMSAWRLGQKSAKCIMYWDKISFLSSEIQDMEMTLYAFENECINLYHDKKTTENDM
jgi:hypothetical protein